MVFSEFARGGNDAVFLLIAAAMSFDAPPLSPGIPLAMGARRSMQWRVRVGRLRAAGSSSYTGRACVDEPAGAADMLARGELRDDVAQGRRALDALHPSWLTGRPSSMGETQTLTLMSTHNKKCTGAWVHLCTVCRILSRTTVCSAPTTDALELRRKGTRRLSLVRPLWAIAHVDGSASATAVLMHPNAQSAVRIQAQILNKEEHQRFVGSGGDGAQQGLCSAFCDGCLHSWTLDFRGYLPVSHPSGSMMTG